MRASTILALAAFSLALVSTAAWADETAKPMPRGNVVTLPVVKIQGRPQHPQVVVNVARLVPRAPLPELRRPLVDGAGTAVDKDPL